MKRILAPLLLFAISLLAPVAAEEEITFDLSEVERGPARIGGYVELRPSALVRDRGAAFTRLRDPGALDSVQDEHRVVLQLDASLEGKSAGLYARTQSTLAGIEGDWSSRTRLYEGYVGLTPSPYLSASLGKKTLKWGKGYAWNPVAFIDRPKDPNEPELALEGFWVATADYTRSFGGPLKTLSLSPVVAPAWNGVNEELGRLNKLNAGGKLYLLFLDTDIDLLFLGGGSRPPQYGLDFSRNLASNFEVHGELAYRPGLQKRWVTAAGGAGARPYDATSALVGLRYLTASDTTFILEYYRNGTGYTAAEMRDYFASIDRAHDDYVSSGSSALLDEARARADWGYGRAHAMRDYLYLRANQKDALGLLYFNPSLTAIWNLNDRSLSLTQELLYAPVTNLELRARLTALVGPRHTEFGEKPANLRAELMARRHF